jgi:hypothetical protein
MFGRNWEPGQATIVALKEGTHWHTPSVGDVLPVKCDPRRQKAKFDTSVMQAQEKARENAEALDQAAKFDAAVNK